MRMPSLILSPDFQPVTNVSFPPSGPYPMGDNSQWVYFYLWAEGGIRKVSSWLISCPEGILHLGFLGRCVD